MKTMFTPIDRRLRETSHLTEQGSSDARHRTSDLPLQPSAGLLARHLSVPPSALARCAMNAPRAPRARPASSSRQHRAAVSLEAMQGMTHPMGESLALPGARPVEDWTDLRSGLIGGLAHGSVPSTGVDFTPPSVRVPVAASGVVDDRENPVPSCAGASPAACRLRRGAVTLECCSRWRRQTSCRLDPARVRSSTRP